MTIIKILLAIVALLNSIVAIVGAIYAFATIRGSIVAIWMTSQILLVVLTLASPFITAFAINYFGTGDIQTAILSQNLLIGVLSLIVSILFVLVVARIEQLKKRSGTSSESLSF